MTSFKQTYIKNYAKASCFVNTDDQYWKNFAFPITVKEYSLIDCIDVSQVEPFYIAVTTGPKVDIYHQQSANVWRSLTRFQRSAYGGRFRGDGKLLVAGSEEAHVKLFNFRLKQLLRVFKGHTGPVHRTCFAYGKPCIASFSDDKTVRLWDIADEKEVCQLEEHTDYIRSGVASPSSEHILLSGSYDHTIKMWDTRTCSSVMTLTHESPITSLLFYPTGSVFASAGGTEVKIWDAVAGKLLCAVSQHHKTITCLSLATQNSRLLSGGLDCHIKIYDLNTYSTIHSMDYPAPILCLGIAPEDSTIVTGMLARGSNPMLSGTGLISFEHKKVFEEKVSARKSTNFRNLQDEDFAVMPGDEVITHIKREKLAKYDKLLCKFQFSKAFDRVMQSGTASNSPHITVAVLRELIRRRALTSSLAGRNAQSLNPLFKFLTKNIRNSSYHRIIAEVTNSLLDLYGNAFGEDNRLFCQLKRFNEELEMDLLITKKGMELMGMMEMFSAIGTSRPPAEGPSADGLSSAVGNNSNESFGHCPDSNHSQVVIDIS